ncbi:GNAT family N-acetyltransferase [Candidatus Woesebacteria bacterium]|nr:GNAT family N-acetyltransferase [Candidatus Woesebacteria bacterium]
MSLTVTIESNASTFTTLQADWTHLLERACTNTIFQTPQFLSCWWEALGFGTLQIVVVRDEAGTLRGIAPLFVEPTNTGQLQLNFVGCVNVSDYLDVIVDREFEKEVYTALFEAIRTQIKFDQFFFCSIPEQSPTRQYIHTFFQSVQETIQDCTPQILLPTSWETYLQSLQRKQRHEIQRKWRRLSELDHHFSLIEDKPTATTAVEEFIMLHRASSQEKNDFWNDAHLLFFTKFIPLAAEWRWLKLFFLEIEGKRVASMLIFDYANHYNLYNSGFLPDHYKEVGTGATLTAYTIKHAIEQQRTIYDFLRGGEGYKLRLGAVVKNVYDLSFQKTPTVLSNQQ